LPFPALNPPMKTQNPAQLFQNSGHNAHTPHRNEGGQNTTAPPNTNRDLDHISENPPGNRKHNQQKMKANIRIASLNINGCHTSDESPISYEKWAEINAMIRNEKIAILALQETHLDHETAQNIQSTFRKQIEIHNSELSHAPRSSAGVTFIINRELIDPSKIKMTKLIKGRAAAIRIKWKGNETNLINIYAPNTKGKNQRFWKMLNAKWEESNLPKPDLLLGDFNLMEDLIDRSPPKHDNASAVESLRDLRRTLDVYDQWRHTHNKAREFTYRAT
jgi:exonuclease III